MSQVPVCGQSGENARHAAAGAVKVVPSTVAQRVIVGAGCSRDLYGLALGALARTGGHGAHHGRPIFVGHWRERKVTFGNRPTWQVREKKRYGFGSVLQRPTRHRAAAGVEPVSLRRE